MGARPLPEGNNAAEMIRRLRAIDAEFFGTLYANSGIIGGDVTIGGSVIISGDLVSVNWDGVTPVDLSAGADGTATTGYAIDSSVGAAQFTQIYAEGGTLGTLEVTGALTIGSGGSLSMDGGVFDIGLDDLNDVNLTDAAPQPGDFLVYANVGEDYVSYTDKNSWTITKVPGYNSESDEADLINFSYAYEWNTWPWGIDWLNAVHAFDIDLGVPRAVRRITWGQVETEEFPHTITIYSSNDGTIWTQRGYFTGLGINDPEEGAITFTQVIAQYWRIEENGSDGMAGQWWINEFDFWTVGAGWGPGDLFTDFLHLDGINSPTTDISWGSNKITGLTAGTASGEAVEFDAMTTAIDTHTHTEYMETATYDPTTIAASAFDLVNAIGNLDGGTFA